MRLYILTAAAMLLSACTIENRGGELSREFHQPFTYAQWRSEQRNHGAGPVCAITSGHGGVTVYVRKTEAGTQTVVQSNRLMNPGMLLRLNVNGRHYETTEEFFSPVIAGRIARDFADAPAGGKAYFEWTDKQSGNPSFVRYTSIARLDGFKEKYDACR